MRGSDEQTGSLFSFVDSGRQARASLGEPCVDDALWDALNSNTIPAHVRQF
jgi:hypothetical protein